MLVYVYMQGSLASHLYNEKHEPLNWNLRVEIAQDVVRGLEYLHYVAVPPVLHRDVKSSNILLDRFMKAELLILDFQDCRRIICIHLMSRGLLDMLILSMSTLIFTKKSDIFSFGVLLFEIMSGKNPQQGLMEYVELVAIDAEDNVGWEEIADSRLKENFDVQQLNSITALAYNCVSPVSRKRPSMRGIVLALSEIRKPENSRVHHRQNYPAKAEETTLELDLQRTVDPSLTER